MFKKPKKTLVATFRSPSSSTEDQAPQNIALRMNSFYGAVYNALDDYFRKEYGSNFKEDDFATRFEIHEDQFVFMIEPTLSHDTFAGSPDEAIQKFFYSIYQIVDSEEIHGVRAIVYPAKDNKGQKYTLSSASNFELMQILENLLAPFDFDSDTSTSFRFEGVTNESPTCFLMFPQYSLHHIRILYRNIQGWAFENQGPYLRH